MRIFDKQHFMYDVVIIGAGIAGFEAAACLRKEYWSFVIVELNV